MGRVPSKESTFEQILRMGIPIEEVIDVGVQLGTLPLISCFPNKRHVLFEPVEEWIPSIERIYKNIDYVLHNVALSDEDGESFLAISSEFGAGITHARLNKNPQDIGNCRRIVTKRLDTVIGESPGPYLLKLDVDGAEINILKGAVRTLDVCSVVVIEAHPRDFFERSEFLVSRGFILLDIVDFCYYEGIMRQFDMVFANIKYLSGYWGPEFDIKKWYEYKP